MKLISEELINKLDSGTLTAADLTEYYEIYTKIANESEYLQDFCKDWNATVFFSTESEADHWIKNENGFFTFGMGKIDNANLIYKIASNIFLRVQSWTYDCILALFGGELSIDGDMSEFSKFFSILL